MTTGTAGIARCGLSLVQRAGVILLSGNIYGDVFFGEMMSEFEVIAKVGEIPAGEGRAFRVAGRLIAVFFVDDQYHAVDDICPHMGASLSTGSVENGGVVCPWHAWRFCIREGTWLDAPKSPIRLSTYEVKVEGENILLRVPPPAGGASVSPTPT